MATEIRVPTLGESVTEATVATWFKKPGETVLLDEMLCELETDKVTVEVPSPAEGRLQEIIVAEGETVNVDALLAILEKGTFLEPNDKKIMKPENEESVDSSINSDASDALSVSSDIRFAGIEDPESKDEIYTAAIEALESQNFDQAFTLFKYFVESFNDEEKTPLAFFWLAEISFIKDDLDISRDLFLELINSYPNHYRIPLAHKKLGDIYLKSNDTQSAKDKYNFVVREYPNNTASSLALQLLKNME